MLHRFDTPEPVTLYAELGRGTLSVRAAETTESTVEVSGDRAEEVSVELDGRQLSIVPPRTRVGFFGGHEPSYTITVLVPSGSDLVTKTGSADLAAEGEYAAGRVKGGSGQVSLGRHAGPVTVDMGSGRVTIADAAADLRIKSGSGDVEVGNVGGTLGVSTGSGDIRIGTTARPAVLKSGSGDIGVATAETDLSLSSASGDLVVGAFHRGSLTAKNASGDVRIGVPSGVPVWTDVSSVVGRIGSDLEGAGQPRPGEDHVELRASSVSGDIVLKQI